jgi:hypothetical protein
LRPKRPDLDPILSQDEEVLEYSRIRFATIKSPPAIDSKDIPNFGVLPGAPNLPEEYDSNVPRFLHFYSQLLLFKEDLHREIFKFPPTLSPAERRIVHTVAHKMKLGHVSKGKGDQRAVHVFRERPDRLSNALEPPPPGKRIQSLR